MADGHPLVVSLIAFRRISYRSTRCPPGFTAATRVTCPDTPPACEHASAKRFRYVDSCTPSWARWVDNRFQEALVRSSYRLAFAGAAAVALLVVGCSASGSAANPRATASWATKTSAAAGGGMTALIAAAKEEGTLNVIALPSAWANYGAILSAFTAKYGIKINSALPEGSSQQEVAAVKTEKGKARAPDVLDLGMAVALANTSVFAPYQVSTWSDIPAAQKDPGGLWYQDYGGYMAIGYSSRFGTITSLNDLLSPKFKNAISLYGSPTSATAALNGVMMASLAEGGSASSIADGVSFFERLKKAGNFSPVQATGATIKAGTTPVVFNWDYLNLPSYLGVSDWKVFIPQNAVLGGYYAQAINKNAPHPAAARLWEEFLYSQAADGGQNLWLEGGARPVELAAMTADGSINKTAAARLPSVSGSPTFLSTSQVTDAANYVAANWTQSVG
jgi:putative spermidine/putrescine transport system substrate-binding protein